MTDKILLSSPHLTGNELKYIKEALDTNWVAPLGPHVDAFENDSRNKRACKNKWQGQVFLQPSGSAGP